MNLKTSMLEGNKLNLRRKRNTWEYRFFSHDRIPVFGVNTETYRK